MVAPALFLLYLLSVAFEAPLRFLLSYIGVADVLYLRDFVAVFFIVYAFYCSWRFKDNLGPLHVCLFVLLVWFFGSVAAGVNVFSAVFGVKLFLPLFLGMAYAQLFGSGVFLNRFFVLALFLVSSGGVLVDYLFGPLVWDGVRFNTSFGVSEVSRVWWMDGGIRRIAGLTRSSNTAAVLVGVLALLLLFLLKNTPARIFVTSLALFVIYATTIRGVFVAFLGSLLLFAIVNSNLRVVGRLFLIFGVFLGLLAPLISWYVSLDYSVMRSAPGFLSSFADRIVVSWPETFDRFSVWVNWIFGLGVGEVGISKQVVTSTRIPPADNIFLYVFANLGLLGLGALIYSVMRVASIWRCEDDWLLFGVFFLMLYGAISNILDDAFGSLFLGVCFGVVFRARSKVDAPNVLTQ